MAKSIRYESLADAAKYLRKITDAREYKEVFEKDLTFLKDRVVLNTPIRTENLRKKISEKVTSVTNRKIDAEIKTDNVDYAMRVHEELKILGPRSMQQPATVEGNVGRKFITRVIRFWNRKEKVQRDVAERTDEILSKEA